MAWLLLCLHFLLIPFSSSLCHPDQSSALLQFKASFTINNHYACGDSVKIQTWENGTDCCSWHGVTCDPISGHVIGLDLRCSGLQGLIYHNSTLFHLSHLQTLNLAFNHFSNSQFSSQFGGFVNLTHLTLSGSYIQGEIPSQISHLSKLVSLDLSGNDELKWNETTWKGLLQNSTTLRELVLDETDMSSIRLLNLSSSLVTISLSSTQLRGNLPNDIFCLPNLQQLYLSDNPDLQDQLPNFRCSTSLSILDLSQCKFQGSIPMSFSNFTHLTSLTLSMNNLNGSIPSSLLTLPRLTFLDLSNNYLSDQIQDVFPQSNKLQKIDLRCNNIGGELPSSLSNLQHLIHLDLSDNNFIGSIPSSLSHLQYLTFLDLSYNKLSGQIPNVFSGLTKLDTLDLSVNNLGGQIPSSLFDLAQLSNLDCSHNKLEGPLPKNIIGFSNLGALSLNTNLLNGTIPSWCLSLPSLVFLDLSNNQFAGHISVISSYSLKFLYLCNNKLQGNIPESIFNIVNLTDLCLSSNNLSGPINFKLFSKLQYLASLSFSHNSQLSPNFKSNVNYSFSLLESLELSSVNLTVFPKSIGKFPSLSYLDLSNNKIKGRLPNWFHEMDSLYMLNLSQNLLTSSIDQFSRIYGLGYLDLSFNLLAGEISSTICNTSFLQILNLSHNKLTGSIPQCLGNLSYLQVLDLQMNKLYGTLPSTFSKNKELKTLSLNGNQLEGHLPKSLSNCTKLEFLNLGNNQIEDTFPYWLQTLPYLQVLILRANKFHGPISNSKTLHPFPSLNIFDISCNNFSGPIPIAYITMFKAMEVNVKTSLQYINIDIGFEAQPFRADYVLVYDTMTTTIKGINILFGKIPTIFVNIDLSENRFEGEIPKNIGELRELKGLNLSHNRLVGSIPQSLGNLTNLESLDLSSNMLTGGIPIELTNLNYLEVLNLSNNHLTGEIPQGNQFNTFSNDSYEGNLGLCGIPLLIRCDKDPEQRSPASSTFQLEQKFGFGWKPVAIGYGCGSVFGVGLGCYILLIGKPQWLVSMVGGNFNR